MDEVEVEVLEVKLLERVLVCLCYVLGLVGVVPELRGDEEVLTLGEAVLEDLVECLADLLLVLVDASQVEVAVASLDGVDDGLLDLAGLREPRTEADLGDRVAVVELEGLLA